MAAASIELPRKLIPVFAGQADVRGAHGGRGSAKTRSFAKMSATTGYRHGMAGTSGIILCARQFMNSLEDSSLEEVKRAIEDEPFLKAYYEVGDKYIKSRDGRISFAFAGLDRSISSVKSKGRLLLCWVDEAEPVTDEAFEILIPTLREEGTGWNAELWVTWNSKRKKAAVEKRFRNSNDPLIKVVELNWRDNPKFPAKLERDRQRDLEENPDQYDHIWEGGFKSVYEGAYFAKELAQAKIEGRIDFVPRDPNMQVRTFWDLGRRDATAIWVAQFVGERINIIDYIEGNGQAPGYYFEQLRQKGYRGCLVVLPHDGSRVGPENATGRSYEDQAKDAGFETEIVLNQGQGAAMLRINALRRIFPRISFNAKPTEPGIDSLAAYHAKLDEKRNVDLGPEHDDASHAADAMGLLAVAYEAPTLKAKPIVRPRFGAV